MIQNPIDSVDHVTLAALKFRNSCVRLCQFLLKRRDTLSRARRGLLWDRLLRSL